MLPLRQVGPSVALTAGAAAAAATVNGAATVWVSNPNAAYGYFSAAPAVFTPTAATGFPIPPGESVLVALSGNPEFWAAFTEGLIVTPVEVMRA